MSRIRSKHTKPEVALRKALRARGIHNYRINNKLLGRPDLYFSKEKIVVFVDGCFWHKCPSCYIEPKSNAQYWIRKIKGNLQRDKALNIKLKKAGYYVIRLWEHDLKENMDKGITRITNVIAKRCQQ